MTNKQRIRLILSQTFTDSSTIWDKGTGPTYHRNLFLSGVFSVYDKGPVFTLDNKGHKQNKGPGVQWTEVRKDILSFNPDLDLRPKRLRTHWHP